jgi:molybdate transport system ATP-binding protein
VADAGLSARLHARTPIALDAQLGCAADEVLALVGPSGSGKSTLLRCIAGLHRPEQGFVRVGGQTWFDADAGVFVPPHRRRVGLVFQHYALFPHMSAQKNVLTALGHLPAAQREARAHALLALVHLDGLQARRPAELSGGQQQRVAVARALARDPAVLLLDEPFSAVDRTTRQKLYTELAEIRSALSAPVIFVTHDFDEAARIAHRMCLLDGGEVVQVGTPRELLARPVSVRAARLVDVKNVFEATVRGHDGTRTLLDWRGRVLVCERQDAYAAGARVAWSIPGANVLLSRTDLAQPDSTLNRLPGRIRELAHLSESVAATVMLDGDEPALLSLTLPAHYARRTGLVPGAAVTIALMADAIHLMPPA